LSQPETDDNKSTYLKSSKNIERGPAHDSVGRNFTYDINLLDEYEQDDLVFTNIRSGDHALIDIDTQDLWLSTVITMNSPDFRNFESKFEIKISRNMLGKELKVIM